jgi:predicted secreted protein
MPNNTCLVYGGTAMLFMNSGATLCALAFATSSKLTVNLSTREITSKDSANWTEKCAGRFDWSMSSENLMNFASTGSTLSTDELYNYFVLRCPVDVAFASASGTSPSWTVNTGVKRFVGCAIITSLDMNATNGETATYSVALEGTGTLSIC